MSNFEYIIASLPVLTADYRYAEGTGFDSTVEEIRRDLDERDRESMDFLLSGFRPENLDTAFYSKALKHRIPFIREYFRFDLNLRNAKVRFLNEQFGRPAGTDVMTGKGTEGDTGLDIDGFIFRGGEFEEEGKVERAFFLTDLLDRERELDDLVWNKVDSLSTFHYFDIEAVLAYLCKLHIADRWLKLDEGKGREMFRRLLSQVRGSFEGIAFNEQTKRQDI